MYAGREGAVRVSERAREVLAAYEVAARVGNRSLCDSYALCLVRWVCTVLGVRPGFARLLVDGWIALTVPASTDAGEDNGEQQHDQSERPERVRVRLAAGRVGGRAAGGRSGAVVGAGGVRGSGPAHVR
nr:hypothetical protein GCM10020241_32930 [Streptoalloteichus tenebrarius]